MNFNQHVTPSIHSQGHSLDLVISYGLQMNISGALDVCLSDCFYILLCSWFYFTGQLGANCEEELSYIWSGSKFTYFHTKLKVILDTVAPLELKNSSTNQTTPWRNEAKQVKWERRKAKRRWRKNTLDYQIFCEKQNICNKAIKHARS